MPPPVIIDGIEEKFEYSNEKQLQPVQEGLLSRYDSKPFTGKYSNIKLVIGKRGTEDIDPKKVATYIQSTILPHLDKVIDQVATRSTPLISRKNPEKVKKWKDRVRKTFRTIKLTKQLINDGYNNCHICI